MKNLRIALALLPLAACIENEERIVVRPDGSVNVSISAKGDIPDLADGYPVPFGPGWIAGNDDTELWLWKVGPDSGSTDAVRNAHELDEMHADDDLELLVSREFSSASDIPHWFSSKGDPYRTAYLERTAALDVQTKGTRSVYVFERVYRAWNFDRLDPHIQIQAALKDMLARFEEENPYTEEEWREIAVTASRIFSDVADLYVRDATVGLYTHGDAALAASELQAILDDARARAGRCLTVERLKLIHEQSLQEDGEEAELIEAVEEELRSGIRTALQEGLARADVEESVRNAILFALEWTFTAQDVYGEMQDETFRVEVELPGTLVGGNFVRSADNVAMWEFDGDRLTKGDVVMRASSVLE